MITQKVNLQWLDLLHLSKKVKDMIFTKKEEDFT